MGAAGCREGTGRTHPSKPGIATELSSCSNKSNPCWKSHLYKADQDQIPLRRVFGQLGTDGGHHCMAQPSPTPPRKGTRVFQSVLSHPISAETVCGGEGGGVKGRAEPRHTGCRGLAAPSAPGSRAEPRACGGDAWRRARAQPRPPPPPVAGSGGGVCWVGVSLGGPLSLAACH